jgi:hypothetical protein
MTGAQASQFIDFHRDFLNPETRLMRIGGGEIGGKASGLAKIRGWLHEHLEGDRFGDIKVDIPSLAVICTDVFDAFMQRNNLYEIVNAGDSDERIAHAFLRSQIPFEMLGKLRTLIQHVHTPLAVRSSSLLEDSSQAPLAGIYATKMIPNNRYDPDLRFKQLSEAIKFVYASTFFAAARDYRQAVGYSDTDEKMAVILQDLVGKKHHNRFYPELSGVARSINYYPMEPAKPQEGVVSLALGLGKTIVDGGVCWTFSPAHPKVGPPFGSPEDLLKNTQTKYWAVNMGENLRYDPARETEYMTYDELATAERDGSLELLTSTYSPLSGRFSIGMPFKGPRALTFAPLLELNQVPLNDLLKELLEIGETAVGSPVEIEFAMNFNPHCLGFLQIRPMIVEYGETQVDIAELGGEESLVSSDHVLGNGIDETLRDIVYTKADVFSLAHTFDMARELEDINKRLLDDKRSYLLIVLGRLGTTDPWLGIPIKWGKIVGASAVVEATQDNVRVELSQGSHYFHNILHMHVKYFTLSRSSQYRVDWDWLGQQKVVLETQFFKHVQLQNPLTIKVDGRSSRGVIYKPRE